MKFQILYSLAAIAAVTLTTPANSLASSCCGSDAAEPAASVEDKWGALLGEYLAIQQALAGDNLEGIRGNSQALAEAAAKLGIEPQDGFKALAQAGDLRTARRHFHSVSQVLIHTYRSEQKENHSLKLAHCPMAFGNQGASWIQKEETLANPYYGAQMLRCGEFIDW